MLRNTTTTFGSISKLLHWLIFILLTLQFILIWQFNISPKGSPDKSNFIFLHKSVGIIILVFGVLFVIWKLKNPQPLPPKTHPRWKQITAKIVQDSLLTLIVIMPIVGYSLTSASGRAINFFGLFTLPNLIPENKSWAQILDVTHEKLGYLLLILAAIHILAALHHHFILKDNVLKRMLP